MKAMFVTAVCMFILGTVMAAAAPVFPVLLGGRLIQGVGTGIALPMMFNIVLEQVPENRLGLMMGIATLITAIAPAVGPSLGGVIVSYFGWRMIFVALLHLLILSFLFGVTSMRQVTETGRVSFQIIDYLLLAAGFACFIFATSMASEAGWTSVRVIVLFLVSVLAIVMFYRRSIHSQSPLIDVKVFHSVTFTLSVIILLLIQFICLGLGYLIPNYSQIVSGEEALIAGCLLLPGCILGACIAPVSGRLLDRFGAKRPILTGVAAIMISLFCFSFFATRLTTALFIAFYLIFTFGQGFSTGNTMTNGLRQLPENLNADGNAVFTTLQQLAGAIGTSVVSTIVASAQAARPDDMALATMEGSRNAFYLLAVLAVAMMCCACGVFFGKKSRI